MTRHGDRSREVFAEAMTLPAPDRTAFVRDRCGCDLDLRAEVESLLAYHEESPDFLEGTALRDAGLGRPLQVEQGVPGARVGRYRIIRTLGEGGMGVVYEAEQDSPKRLVALKVLRTGTGSLLKRFSKESVALGLLHHPGIAQIYEAGADESGRRPYIAMELVEGMPITDHARALRLGTRDRLDLFARVCDAVHHAHERGVIHRDLKPANVLVDGTGQPKVLDFGIARIARGTDVTTVRTDIGQLMGTLAYMSPEQAVAAPGAVDAPSDVYALGVLLYELLSDRTPLELSGKPVPAAVLAIQQQDPTPLSAINRVFRGDIETIVGKALEKDPRRRYQTAADLAGDVRRYLRDQPIVARPPSRVYQLAKFAKRNKPIVAGAVATLAALVLGIAGTSWQAVRTTAQRDRARLAESRATAARAEADAKSVRLRRGLYYSQIGYAQAAYAAGDADRMKRLLADCPEDLRGWEWRYLSRLADTSQEVLQAAPAGLFGAHISHASGRIATMRNGREADDVRIWDAATHEVVATVEGIDTNEVGSLSPDGKRLAVGLAGGGYAVYELETGESLWSQPGTKPAVACQYSAQGDRILTVGPDESMIRDASTGEVLFHLADGLPTVTCAAFNHDSTLVAMGNSLNGLGVWDAATGARRSEFQNTAVNARAVAFAPDGSSLVVALQDACALWDLASGTMRWKTQPHGNQLTPTIAFRADSGLIAAGGVDSTIRLLDPANGDSLRTLRGHADEVNYVSFTPDGSRLVSASRDGTVRWWDDLLSEDPPRLWIWDHWVRGMVFSADGARLYCATNHGVDEWDPRTREYLGNVEGPNGDIRGLDFHAPTGLVAFSSRRGNIRVFKADARARVMAASVSPISVWSVAISPDGRTLAASSSARAIHLYEISTGAEAGTISVDNTALHIAWMPDGRRLISGHHDGTVRLWHVETASVLASVVAHPGGVYRVTASPDGTRIVTTGADTTIKVWAAGLDGEPMVLAGHKRAVFGLSIDPSGRRLVSGGADAIAKLWDLGTGEEILTLSAHTWALTCTAFSPDGHTIATGGDSVRLWVAPTEPEG